MHTLAIRRRLILIAVLLLPLLVVGMRQFPPTTASWYPRCLLHQTTGLHCPGCGGTRGVCALVQGDLGLALRCNLLLVLALPFLAVWAVQHVWTALRGLPAPVWSVPRFVIWLVFSVVVVFFAVRNLPMVPCAWLAPPQIPSSSGPSHE